jgi:hypothetical protein
MRIVAALALGCVLLASRAADAKYTPLSFSRRVFDADVITVGTIEALRENDYDLRVETWIAGPAKAETLRVRRFVDWTCASRKAEYAVGQRLVSFLGRSDGELSAMGAACEGDVFLENGRAHVRFSPDVLDDSAEPLSEERLVAALRAVLSGYREVGAPGFVEAWRAVLAHEDPLVAATAMDRLDVEAEVNPGPASAFADALVDVVARPERALRLDAARRLAGWLDPPQRAAAGKRLGQAMLTGRADLRPAAALGWIAADPSDPARHAAAFELLADESVPLAERDAAAALLAHPDRPVPDGFDTSRLSRAARDAVARIRDPSLLLHVCGYAAWLHGRYEWPEPEDAAVEQAKWLDLLAKAPAPAGEAPIIPTPKDDPYLAPAERAVFVPHHAENRAFIARVVRAARRARNADRAGDRTAALDAYRDMCSAAVAVRDGMKPVLRDLGVDLDELTKRARELVASDE